MAPSPTKEGKADVSLDDNGKLMFLMLYAIKPSVNFAAIATAMNLPSKEAAAKRWSRLSSKLKVDLEADGVDLAALLSATDTSVKSPAKRKLPAANGDSPSKKAKATKKEETPTKEEENDVAVEEK